MFKCKKIVGPMLFVSSISVASPALELDIEQEALKSPEVVADTTVMIAPEIVEVEKISTLRVSPNEDIRKTLSSWAGIHDYTVLWETDKTINTPVGIQYTGNFRDNLSSLAKDISTMGIDLNFKVFNKNKVIIVYSVR